MYFFGCIERCAFPHYYPGDIWCEIVAFYCPVFFRPFCVVLIVCKIELFCLVAKPVSKICFGGSYVNSLLKVELIQRDLCFINDVWVKHFPSRGQLFLILQLQLSSISAVLFKPFIMWFFIKDFVFFMQL